MKKTLTLGIPRPCTESWADMTPENQGRFCGSCQKTVVDFTAMTDHELLQWFTHHHGAVCGRFTPDQLARPITTLPKTSHNRWRYWQYIIAGLLFSAKVSAQTKPVRPQTTQYLPIGLDNTLKGDTILIADKVPPPDSLRKSIAVATGSLTGFVGSIVVMGKTTKKRNPIADTLSIIKDTLASITLAKPALTAYPNPVARGGSINITARLPKTGKYNVQLFHTSGALIVTREIDKKANLSLPIPATLVPGTYFVRLSGQDLTNCYSQEIMVY